MDSMIFSLASLGFSACAVGYAWSNARAAKAAAARTTAAINNANSAHQLAVSARAATGSLEDTIEERFDAVYAELENHSKTFAKSRKGRVAKKATSEPKPASSNGVNNYMTEGGA